MENLRILLRSLRFAAWHGSLEPQYRSGRRYPDHRSLPPDCSPQPEGPGRIDL